MSTINEGRHLWSGDLARENVDLVAGLFEQVLVGNRFTVITVTSDSGWRPDVRMGMEVEEFHRYTTESGVDGFCVTDGHYVTGLHTRHDTQAESRNDDVKYRTRVEICERSIRVSHFAASGNELRWMWMVDDVEPEYRAVTYGADYKTKLGMSGPLKNEAHAEQELALINPPGGRGFVERRWASTWEGVRSRAQRVS